MPKKKHGNQRGLTQRKSQVTPKTSGPFKIDVTMGNKLVIETINKALENPKFKYRTIPGIAKEAGISEVVVQKNINEVPDLVISTKKTNEGLPLFTTRNHLKKAASLSERILAVITNKVD